MRYLILLCSFVAILLFEPQPQAVAAPDTVAADGQVSGSATSLPLDVVAPEPAAQLGSQPAYADSNSRAYTLVVSSGPGVLLRDFKIVGCCITPTNTSTLADHVSGPGVLLLDFKGASSPSGRLYSNTIDDVKRLTCVWYGDASPEAVPRRGA